MSESRKLPPSDPAIAASWKANNRILETYISVRDQRTYEFLGSADIASVIDIGLKILDGGEKHSGRPAKFHCERPLADVMNPNQETQVSDCDRRTYQFFAENCEDSMDVASVVSIALKLLEDIGKKRVGRPAGIKVNGARLRKLREAKGMTQQQLADAAGSGIVLRTVQNYEQSGRAEPERLADLARVLEISPSSLCARYHGVLLECPELRKLSRSPRTF